MNDDRYPAIETERRWQAWWRENHIHDVDLDAVIDKKQYILVMFSYPSASKLHIGHWWNYGPTDTYCRFKRMQGYTVFEPMGFDSFGLPAENYAIKVGSHPKEVTESSIASIEKQLEAIGAMYDWSHKVVTSRPDYYKWTQWLFLKLFEHGLAYQKEGLVNWCTNCQTVLANEQVSSEGFCERCHAEVIQRKMTQWYFRITKYADQLLKGLEKLDWQESTVKRQANWIGRSEGTLIRFPLADHDGANGEGSKAKIRDSSCPSWIEVFTTRPDTLYGVTYMVIAPENDLIPQLTTSARRAYVEGYIEEASKVSEVERTSTMREKTGVFTGSYALHPFTGEKLEIWIADYVLGSYGTGAVMAVPAHDQRDFEFALKYSLPIKVVIRPEKDTIEVEEMREAYELPGIMVNSGQFSGLRSEDGIHVITEKLREKGMGGPEVTYRIRDWSISRQRYWGAPIPIIHCPSCGAQPIPEADLPLLLPETIQDFRPKGSSPLGAEEEWLRTPCPRCGGEARRDPDTLDTFVDSSFYHLRYLSAEDTERPFNLARMKRWLPIDTYVGGADHATGHLIYFRFITRFLHDIGWCPVEEPAKRLIHQGVIKHGGIKMSKSKGNVIIPDPFVAKYGSDVFRMYMMFMGAYLEGGDWSDEGISGIDRFLNRVWRLILSYSSDHPIAGELKKADYPAEVWRILHGTIKAVIHDLETFSFNTAISRMMELVNVLYVWLGDKEIIIDKLAVQRLLNKLILIMAPFAPHFAEESWRRLGNDGSIFNHLYPTYDETALTAQTYTLVVQVNGKLRDRIEAAADTDDKTLEKLALSSDKVVEFLKQGSLQKVIVIPGKLVNLVIH